MYSAGEANEKYPVIAFSCFFFVGHMTTSLRMEAVPGESPVFQRRV